MKKPIRLFVPIIGVALCCAAAWAVEQKVRVEAVVLPASAYRTPLQEIIVEGKTPYWRHQAPPNWSKPKVEAPKPGEEAVGRMQWLPRYTREERDDYNGVREQLSNPPPRTKLFEIRF